MKTIELHIECYGDNDELSKLGIESDAKTEWRPCTVPVDAIMLIYPMRVKGTLITIGGEDYQFRENYAEVKELLQVIHSSSTVL